MMLPSPPLNAPPDPGLGEDGTWVGEAALPKALAIMLPSPPPNTPPDPELGGGVGEVAPLPALEPPCSAIATAVEPPFDPPLFEPGPAETSPPKLRGEPGVGCTTTGVFKVTKIVEVGKTAAGEVNRKVSDSNPVGTADGTADDAAADGGKG